MRPEKDSEGRRGPTKGLQQEDYKKELVYNIKGCNDFISPCADMCEHRHRRTQDIS